MRTAFIFLGLLALAASATWNPKTSKKTVDKVWLTKQKAVIELLYRVNQPVLDAKILEVGSNYDIFNNEAYTNPEVTKKFLGVWKYGMLPKDEVFTIFNDELKKETIALYDLFYFAKDWDTFYKTAAWARVNVNPGQFVYCFYVAVLHREDTRGLVLPPPYEVYPQLFVETEVIQKAYDIRMQSKANDVNQEYLIQSNRSVLYPFYLYEDEFTLNKPKDFIYRKYQQGVNFHDHVNSESRVNYFTEDAALNTYYNYLHLVNPFWMNKTYNYNNEYHGELFYFYNQQILARYQMERLSNDLLEIDAFTFQKSVEVGYNPNLRYPNGKYFPVRPDNVEYYDMFDTYHFKLIRNFERRLFDAVDLGFVVTEKGEKVPITDEHGINVLGELIESTVNSVNYHYYGKIYRMVQQALGHIVDRNYHLDVAPGVLEHYETVLRDPLYYRVLKAMNYVFYRYKSNLPVYKREDLSFPGIKVESVDVDKLVTYFEHYDVDISQSVQIKNFQENPVIKARQYRLNHKPFNFKVNVVSDKATNVLVRVFIGPKYDAEGQVLDMNKKRQLMVELDRFPYEVTVGQNTIVRSSKDILTSYEEFASTKYLYETVEKALQGKVEMNVEELERYTAFPDHLLLPKGKRGGMPFTFFVAITPYNSKVETTVKHVDNLVLYYKDQYALGYPFDRVIDIQQFFVPNFYEKDVIVFHKPEDVTASQ